MLRELTEFPHIGSIGYLARTAEPARVLQRCADGTLFVERLKRTPSGGTAPLEGAAANRRVEASEIFADLDAAMFAGQRRRRAARGR